jgi:hypothetical protein
VRGASAAREKGIETVGVNAEILQNDIDYLIEFACEAKEHGATGALCDTRATIIHRPIYERTKKLAETIHYRA